VSQPFITPSL